MVTRKRINPPTWFLSAYASYIPNYPQLCTNKLTCMQIKTEGYYCLIDGCVLSMKLAF